VKDENYQLLYSDRDVKVVGKHQKRTEQDIIAILRQTRLIPWHWGDPQIEFSWVIK